MKKVIIALMLCAASVLTSCQKPNGPSRSNDYLIADYSVTIGELDFAVYDYTLVFTEFATGKTETKALTEPEWSYKFSEKGKQKPAVVVVKITGTLKADAADIIAKLASERPSMERGYICTLDSGFYKDAAAIKLSESFIVSHSGGLQTINASGYAKLLDRPTVTIANFQN